MSRRLAEGAGMGQEPSVQIQQGAASALVQFVSDPANPMDAQNFLFFSELCSLFQMEKMTYLGLLSRRTL